MKILLCLIATFFAAALVSYTFKADLVVDNHIKEITRCMPEDIREIAKMEAATKEFAALHPDPLYFKAKDPKGKRVSFRTPDGLDGAG